MRLSLLTRTPVVRRNVVVRFNDPKKVPNRMIVGDRQVGHNEAVSGEWPPTMGLVDAEAEVRRENKEAAKKKAAQKLGAHKPVDMDPTEGAAEEAVSGEWPPIHEDLYAAEKKNLKKNKK